MSEASAKITKTLVDTPQLKKGEFPPGMQKVCGVCGDRALGYNFNAISCESCKAFFRRNAATSKEFKCPFSNACKITAVTRRFCQKCRLEKCFAVGMVKEYIMSEDDKAEKRKKIEENRAKKRTCKDTGEDLVTSSKRLKREYDSNPVSPLITNENSSNLSEPSPSILQYNDLNSTTCSPSDPVNSPLSDVDSQTSSPYQYGHQSAYSPYPQPYYPDVKTALAENLYAGARDGQQYETEYERDDTIRIPIEPNSIESILCEAIKLEFEAYSSVSHGQSSSRELNEVERAKLNELIVANKALHAPIDMDITSLVEGATDFKDGKRDPALLTIINLTAVAIRRLIKMAKKINAFKNMCEEDQVALLKGGCTEMMVLRSAIIHDDARNTWKIPHRQERQSNIKTDILKLAKGNVYQAHEAFIRSFDVRARTDENVVLIMSAILLFTPERPSVVHRDVVKLERNSYYYLLRRYLESVYPGCEAKSIFLKLIQKIMELHRLAEEVIGVYLDVNPIEPLLMEIFDLKQHTT